MNADSGRLVSVALAALTLGTAVYLLDRGWQSTWFLTVLGTQLRVHAPGDLVGVAGQWLPSFTHTFGFSILTAAALGWTARARHIGCATWVTVNTLFELLQLRTLGLLPGAFAGRFDGLDLVAVACGGMAAYGLMALVLRQRKTARRANPGRASRTFAATLVTAVGLTSILGSGPGPEGPTDIRDDTSELSVYGFSIQSGTAAPAELLVTFLSGGLEYTDALTFTGSGLSGLYDTTDGFTLDPGSAFTIDTDRSTPQLGTFTVTVVDALGPFDSSALDFGGGGYRVMSGTDSVLVRITALDIPDDAGPSLAVELRLNDDAPLILDWDAFTDVNAPLWQRQAVQAYSSLSYLFDTVVSRTIFKAENLYDPEAGPEAVSTACDTIVFGTAAPGNVVNPGSASTTLISPGTTGSGDDVAIRFADCTVSFFFAFLKFHTLYRGDLALLGATSLIDSRNVLTNFGFAAVQFADLQLYGLSANPPPTSLGTPTTLEGGLAIAFFPP